MPMKILMQSMDIKMLLDNPNLIHYVGMINPPRPGVQECFTALEYTHFPPGTPLNDEFQMAVIEWNEIGWAVISIPLAKAHFMKAMADQCGLRITDGIPMMVTSEGFERFPFANNRLFSLENKSGHPVYRNDPATDAQLRAAERATVEQILGER